MGIRTFGLYIVTTGIAVTIGLVLVNVIQPGTFISDTTRQDMLGMFGDEVGGRVESVVEVQEDRGPLQPLVDIFPENIFESATANSNMLQIIFFSLFVGISMILLPFGEISALKKVMDAGNAVVLKIVDLIMMFAPYGVFALIATLI